MRLAPPGPLAVLLLATSMFVPSALGATIVNAKTPFAATTLSDCTGELVALVGEMHTLVRFGESGDRQHFGFDVHITGVKGTGLPSGARYVEMDVQNTQANVTPLGQQEFTAERTMNLTRLGEDKTFGDGDDMRVHVVAHMTVDANGVVRVDKTDATNECR
jgi:hypothetical protein